MNYIEKNYINRKNEVIEFIANALLNSILMMKRIKNFYKWL